MDAVCLISSHRRDAIGGIETFINSLATWLRRNQLQTIVATRNLSLFNPLSVSLDDEAHEVASSKNIKTIRVNEIWFTLYLFYFSLVATFSLIKVAKRHNVVIVHAQDNFAALCSVFANFVCGFSVVLHSHGPEYLHKHSFASRAINTTLDKYVAHSVDQVIVTDDVTFDYFRHLDVSETKILKIPTAIDTNLIQSNNVTPMIFKTKNDANAKFVVGYIGRLSQEKNVSTLLEAFAQLKSQFPADFRLVLVGDGPELKSLKTFVVNKKLSDSVLFTGWRNDVHELLHTFDVFVLPSLFEGSPIALLEAMLDGKSIIASNIPSIRALVTNNEEAILVDPYTANEFKQAILLLHNDSGLRIKLSKNARKRVLLYDVNNIYMHILQMYEKLINKAHAQKASRII